MWTVGTESRSGNSDQRWVVLAQHCGPKGETVHDAWSHVVDDGVAAFH